jgi:metal-responsive CopG/Arc/MetJ family transcriptional regulator
MRIQISIDEELASRIDEYASKNYLSRSGLISLACTQFLQSNEAVLALSRLSLSMQKIADTGSIDDETQQELQDISRSVSLLIGS